MLSFLVDASYWCFIVPLEVAFSVVNLFQVVPVFGSMIVLVLDALIFVFCYMFIWGTSKKIYEMKYFPKPLGDAIHFVNEKNCVFLLSFFRKIWEIICSEITIRLGDFFNEKSNEFVEKRKLILRLVLMLRFVLPFINLHYSHE